MSSETQPNNTCKCVCHGSEPYTPYTNGSWCLGCYYFHNTGQQPEIPTPDLVSKSKKKDTKLPERCPKCGSTNWYRDGYCHRCSKTGSVTNSPTSPERDDRTGDDEPQSPILETTKYVHVHQPCDKCDGCKLECEHQVKYTMTTTTDSVTNQEPKIKVDRSRSIVKTEKHGRDYAVVPNVPKPKSNFTGDPNVGPIPTEAMQDQPSNQAETFKHMLTVVMIMFQDALGKEDETEREEEAFKYAESWLLEYDHEQPNPTKDDDELGGYGHGVCSVCGGSGRIDGFNGKPTDKTNVLYLPCPGCHGKGMRGIPEPSEARSATAPAANPAKLPYREEIEKILASTLSRGLRMDEIVAIQSLITRAQAESERNLNDYKAAVWSAKDWLDRIDGSGVVATRNAVEMARLSLARLSELNQENNDE